MLVSSNHYMLFLNIYMGFPGVSDSKDAMCQIWVWTLVWEDPLEEGTTTHSTILAWGILMDRGAWWATVHGVPKSQTWLSDSAQHDIYIPYFTCPYGFLCWLQLSTVTIKPTPKKLLCVPFKETAEEFPWYIFQNLVSGVYLCIDLE